MTLRFDQYKDRTDITKMIHTNPHNQQFETINKLPLINSKFKNSYKHEIKRTIGRVEASPINAGHLMRTNVPNSPSKTAFYQADIPKFNKGQPGYQEWLNQTEK